MESMILLLAVFFSCLACISACISVADDLLMHRARRKIYEQMKSEVNRLHLEVKIRRGE